MTGSAPQVFPVAVPGRRRHDGEPFPLALGCRSPGASPDDVAARVIALAGAPAGQAPRQGAILFRGLPPRSAEHFDRFVAAFGPETFASEDPPSNAVRARATPTRASSDRRRGPPGGRPVANSSGGHQRGSISPIVRPSPAFVPSDPSGMGPRPYFSNVVLPPADPRPIRLR